MRVDRSKWVQFERAKYIGGLEEWTEHRHYVGLLQFRDDKITLNDFEFRLSSIKSVTVYGAEVGKSRVGATLAFGALGAAASKPSKSQTTLVFQRHDGRRAYILVDRVQAIAVKAALDPWMRSHDLSFTDDEGAGPTAEDLASQIEKLESLRAGGVLTQEEFSAAKSKLLGM